MVLSRHLLAGNALGEAYDPRARENRYETRGKRWGKAFNPQVARHFPGRERQHCMKEQLPNPRSRSSDRKMAVAHTVTRLCPAAGTSRYHGDPELLGQSAGDHFTLPRAPAAVIWVVEAIKGGDYDVPFILHA